MITPIQADTPDQVLDFNVRKETLWEDATAQGSEVSRRQTEFIRKFHANDPAIGYNRWPAFKPGH